MAKLTDLLVVSDIDGTLLQAGYGIPKENIDAIERFVERKGRFTVCTGRSVPSVRRYVDWIQPTAPCILNNGALIYDYKREKILYNVHLADGVINIVKEIITTFPDVGAELHSSKGIVIVRQNEQTHNHVSVEHIPFELADITKVSGKWNKVFFAMSSQRIQQVANFIQKRQRTDMLYREFDYVTSAENYFEIVPKGINKGTGLKKLAEILKVSMENTVAIGDYYNDLSMFEVAGHTAAVADAPEDIRSKVDKIVSSCLHGGVGELLDSLDELCEGFEQMRLDI